MSILNAVDPITVVFTWIFVAATLLAMALFFLTGSQNPNRIVGQSSLQPPQPAWPIVLVFMAAAFVWFGSSALFAAYVQARHASSGTTGTTRPFGPADFTPTEMAVLSTVPPLLALGVFFVAYRFLYPIGPRLLGFTASQIPRGLLLGLLACLIILPAVYWSGDLTERLYRHVGFRHPREHELLQALGNSRQPLVQSLIVLAATVLAPIFEELLFRGHLQTLIKHALRSRSPHRRLWPLPPYPSPTQQPPFLPSNTPLAPLGLAPPAIMQLPPGAGPIVLSYEPPPPPPAPVPPSAWRSWLAVIIVALIFALVHPLWSAPPIFVLAVGLGYVYERTGNLYASMTVHALFNIISTIEFYQLMS